MAKFFTLSMILLFAVALSARDIPTPTGTATPMTLARPINVLPQEPDDPTQNIVCAFFIANWGESKWTGSRMRPWSYQAYNRGKSVARNKWVCDISNNLDEVNGTPMRRLPERRER